MRRYELMEGSTAFFWEIQMFERHFDIREGVGQAITRSRQWDFRTPGRARAEYRRHVEWRTRAGFTLVHSDPLDDEIVNVSVSEAGAEMNPDIEALIHDDPEAPDAWLVYGDWLESRGHERGELVQVQAARATAPHDVKLREREETLLADNERAWLGDLADLDEGTFHCTWKFGFLEQISLTRQDLIDAHGACRALASLSAARLLRVLRLQISDGDGFAKIPLSSLLETRPFLSLIHI